MPPWPKADFSVTQARKWLIMQDGPCLDAYFDGLREAGLPD